MSTPTNRAEFKEYCLRKLGKPVINIEVSEEQIDDRVTEALKFYMDYHYDGTEKQYYKHIVTADDITNKYITLPENIIGVVKIFNIAAGLSAANMFSIQYQIALNDLYSLISMNLAPYVSAMQNIQLIEEILVGRKPIRFNRHRDRLHLDMDWSIVDVGNYLIVEAHEVVDPDTYTDVWGDRWLQNYCTLLIKRQWGEHLKKFGGIQMVGGVVFNGQQIYDEADQTIKEMERTMIMDFSLPPMDMIG